MPQPRLTEGEYVDTQAHDPLSGKDAQIAELGSRVRGLTNELSQMRAQLVAERAHFQSIMSALRSHLAPFYNLLQVIFAELNSSGIVLPDDAPGAPQQQQAVLNVWEAWKRKLPSPCGRIIDALLTHRELNTQQIAIAAQMHRNNVPKYIYHLNKAGLINKNGNVYSLKQLA